MISETVCLNALRKDPVVSQMTDHTSEFYLMYSAAAVSPLACTPRIHSPHAVPPSLFESKLWSPTMTTASFHLRCSHFLIACPRLAGLPLSPTIPLPHAAAHLTLPCGTRWPAHLPMWHAAATARRPLPTCATHAPTMLGHMLGLPKAPSLLPTVHRVLPFLPFMITYPPLARCPPALLSPPRLPTLTPPPSFHIVTAPHGQFCVMYIHSHKFNCFCHLYFFLRM